MAEATASAGLCGSVKDMEAGGEATLAGAGAAVARAVTAATATGVILLDETDFVAAVGPVWTPGAIRGAVAVIVAVAVAVAGPAIGAFTSERCDGVAGFAFGRGVNADCAPATAAALRTADAIDAIAEAMGRSAFTTVAEGGSVSTTFSATGCVRWATCVASAPPDGAAGAVPCVA
jgi:hypothetical protein